MENIIQQVRLNLSEDGIPPRLHMTQGDANSRTICATLYDGAAAYTIPTNAAVMVRFRKPDGTGGLYDETESGAAVTFAGSTVTAPVATQMLSVAGTVQVQFDIYGKATGKSAELLSTFRFAVDVAPSVYPDVEIISSDYYNIVAAQIAAAVKAGVDAKASAGAAAASAENAAASAATASDKAGAASTSAGNAASSASAAAGSAGSAAASAATASDKADAASTSAGNAASSASAAAASAAAAQQAAAAAASAAVAVSVSETTLVLTTAGQTGSDN